MDEDSSPPAPPPLLTENNTNNIINNIPYLFTPSLLSPSTSSNMNQYYPSTSSSSLILHQPPSPHITQSSNQFALDNIDWLRVDLSGNSVTYGGADDQMQPSTSTVSVLASLKDNTPISSTELRGDHRSKRKAGRTKKSVPPRVAFHTRSSEDILDDGYKWRKYGQKAVKNTKYPRSYYRCTHHTCNVKKQIQRLSKDNSVVLTTYEGIHNHPCEKLMETLSPLLRQLQFLSRF